MSSLRIKQRQPKYRRRGQRLIVTNGTSRKVYCAYGKGMRLTEVADTDEHFVISYSTCGDFALGKGHDKCGPTQFVARTAAGEPIASRECDESPWFFIDQKKEDKLLVSASQTGIVNAALIASAMEGRIDQALANFLGISPVLCAVDDVGAIHQNPRFRTLRGFDFCVTPPSEPIGTGRRAENTMRHRHSNYDAMLQAEGGLLFPDEYDRVRRGVDLLVKNYLQDAAGSGRNK
jgi:hypothetical protein